ncbi:hypothetical protein C4K68_21600 [Pokkaliibacter plantistimulans]|uniref:Uncharacterized protein n=2 Tax=Pseudomonadota TaxID=1224 RepID=A0A2S5KLP9_9PROT|nr:hypothetical protein C4K68_21600 [Pokkaliibacter plantistimulans]
MRAIFLFIIMIFAGKVMASEPAKAIALQTSDGQHIGFTLFHPDFGADKGDCVFIIVPKSIELFESKEVSTLLDIKESGEHPWVRSEDGVTIFVDSLPTLKYRNDGTVIYLPSNTELGIWFSTVPN